MSAEREKGKYCDSEREACVSEREEVFCYNKSTQDEREFVCTVYVSLCV